MLDGRLRPLQQHLRMTVVTGGNHDGLQLGIGKHGRHISAGLAEAELAAKVNRTDAAGGRNV